MMATTSEVIAALSQNLDDMSALADQLIAFIVAADGVQADLRAQIEALVAGNASVAAAVSAAFDKSEAVENKMRDGLPGVPPVGGEPLVQSYADRASFDAAVAAYTGPEAVTVDGIEVKSGTMPSLDYFSHSADGSVSTTGPTD
jgi:hypothetical protein